MKTTKWSKHFLPFPHTSVLCNAVNGTPLSTFQRQSWQMSQERKQSHHRNHHESNYVPCFLELPIGGFVCPFPFDWGVTPASVDLMSWFNRCWRKIARIYWINRIIWWIHGSLIDFILKALCNKILAYLLVERNNNDECGCDKGPSSTDNRPNIELRQIENSHTEHRTGPNANEQSREEESSNVSRNFGRTKFSNDNVQRRSIVKSVTFLEVQLALKCTIETFCISISKVQNIVRCWTFCLILIESWHFLQGRP